MYREIYLNDMVDYIVDYIEHYNEESGMHQIYDMDTENIKIVLHLLFESIAPDTKVFLMRNDL